jgi:hypothetical protein
LHVGSTALADAVRTRQIAHHVFGHLHDAGGQTIQRDVTTFHNVAACNEQYGDTSRKGNLCTLRAATLLELLVKHAQVFGFQLHFRTSELHFFEREDLCGSTVADNKQ